VNGLLNSKLNTKWFIRWLVRLPSELLGWEDKTMRVNKPPQLNEDYMVQNVILLFQNVPEVKIDELDHSEWAS
jgi:hypothetical protein